MMAANPISNDAALVDDNISTRVLIDESLVDTLIEEVEIDDATEVAPATAKRRTCEGCHSSRFSKTQYYKHIKKCALYIANRTLIIENKKTYPKTCAKCEQVYKSKQTFYRHTIKCLSANAEATNGNLQAASVNDLQNALVNDLNYQKTELNTHSNNLEVENQEVIIEDDSYNGFTKDYDKSSTCFIAQCRKCHLAFLNSRSFARHTTENCKVMKKYRIRCIHEGCNLYFVRHILMVTHLQRHHMKRNLIQKLNFPSLDEFEIWKTNEKVDKCMHVVQSCGVKTVNTKQYIYYVCRYDIQDINKHLRKTKTSRRRSAGTIPYQLCPARMLVMVKETGVRVTYISEHNHLPTDYENVLITNTTHVSDKQITTDTNINECSYSTVCRESLSDHMSDIHSGGESLLHSVESEIAKLSHLVQSSQYVRDNLLEYIYENVHSILNVCNSASDNEIII